MMEETSEDRPWRTLWLWGQPRTTLEGHASSCECGPAAPSHSHGAAISLRSQWPPQDHQLSLSLRDR